MTAEFADQLGTFDQPWKASSNLKIKSSCFWLTTGTNQPHSQSNKSIFELVTQTFRKACKTWKWVTYKMFALARLASLAMVRELPNSCFFKQYENSYSLRYYVYKTHNTECRFNPKFSRVAIGACWMRQSRQKSGKKYASTKNALNGFSQKRSILPFLSVEKLVWFQQLFVIFMLCQPSLSFSITI